MRLIDANALLENGEQFINEMSCQAIIEPMCSNIYNSLNEIKWFKNLIIKAPTVTLDDIRPKGEWIMHDDEILGLSCECSVCHIETMGDTPFCPNCGADMRGEG